MGAVVGGAAVALMRSASLGVDITQAKTLAASSKALLARLQPALAFNEEDAFDAAKLLLSTPSDTIAHAAVVGGHKLDSRMESDPLAGPLSLLIHTAAVAAAGDEAFSVRGEAPPHVTGLNVVLLLLRYTSKLIRSTIFSGDAASAAAGGAAAAAGGAAAIGGAGAVEESEVEAMLAKVRERGIRVAAFATNLFGLADFDGAAAAAEAAQAALADARSGHASAADLGAARIELEKASVRLARSAANVALAARFALFAAETGAAAGSGTEILHSLPAMLPVLLDVAGTTTIHATDAVVGSLAFVLDAIAEPWAEIEASFAEDHHHDDGDSGDALGLVAKAAALRAASTREGVSEATVDYASSVAEKLTAIRARLSAQAARRAAQEEDDSRAELANELYAEMLAERRADIEAAREAKAHRAGGGGTGSRFSSNTSAGGESVGAAEAAEDPDALDLWVSKNHQRMLLAKADLDEERGMSGPWFSGKRYEKTQRKAADTDRAAARAAKSRGGDDGDA